MGMDRRIERLEQHPIRRGSADPFDYTEDELAAIATGGKVTRAEALTDDELAAIIAAGEITGPEAADGGLA